MWLEYLSAGLEVLDGSSNEASYEIVRGDHCVVDLVCHSVIYSKIKV